MRNNLEIKLINGTEKNKRIAIDCWRFLEQISEFDHHQGFPHTRCWVGSLGFITGRDYKGKQCQTLSTPGRWRDNNGSVLKSRWTTKSFLLLDGLFEYLQLCVPAMQDPDQAGVCFKEKEPYKLLPSWLLLLRGDILLPLQSDLWACLQKLLLSWATPNKLNIEDRIQLDLYSRRHRNFVASNWRCCHFDSAETKVKGADFGAVEEVEGRIRGKRKDRIYE